MKAKHGGYLEGHVFGDSLDELKPSGSAGASHQAHLRDTYISYSAEDTWDAVHAKFGAGYKINAGAAVLRKLVVRTDAPLYLSGWMVNARTAVPELTEQLRLRAGPLVRLTEVLTEVDRGLIIAVSALVHDRLTDMAAAYAAVGESLSTRYSAAQLAERMAATVPEHTPWSDVLGSCYSVAAVAKMRNTSPEEVARMQSERLLLGIETSDGVTVFPEWQFADDAPGHLRPELRILLARFPQEFVDDLTVAGWMRGRNRRLDGLTPLEWLTEGRSFDAVDAAARAAAARLSH